MSLSNTKASPFLSGAAITHDSIRRPTDPNLRRTKIICTLGPACWSEGGLATLMDAGMNTARFNFSHGDHEGHGAVLDRLRAVAREKKRNIAVLLDTKGPEIRSGFLAKETGGKIDLVKGQTMVLTTDYHFKGDANRLACSYPALAKTVKPGQEILVADGSLVLTVLTTDEAAGEVTCRIENNTSIGERKNMNLPGVEVDLPTFTEKDVEDIVNFGIKKSVDMIAASFVRKASDVTNLRDLLQKNGGSHIKILCKIENQEGLQNYDAILKETDGIMVARGDLGMEIPPAKVFLAQKLMIRKANVAGKPVITATQMLESMIKNPRPTRAECSDVANAVYDGTDVVMLSGETANGPNYEAAVKVMARTCVEAEASRNYMLMFRSVINSIMSTRGELSTGESIASSAVKSALDTKAKLIVVMSETGRMAQYVAKFRPACSVLCMTTNENAARQSSGLLQGTHTVVVDSLTNADELIDDLNYELFRSGLVKEGETIVLMAGRQAGMREQLRIIKLSRGKWHGHFVENDDFFYERSLLLNYVF